MPLCTGVTNILRQIKIFSREKCNIAVTKGMRR
jgi:hypothetical protein